MEKHLIKIVAASLKEDPKMVADIINFYEKFIADTIQSGCMENVRVPLFGIFRVNLKRLRYLNQVLPAPKVKIVKPENPTQ